MPVALVFAVLTAACGAAPEADVTAGVERIVEGALVGAAPPSAETSTTALVPLEPGAVPPSTAPGTAPSSGAPDRNDAEPGSSGPQTLTTPTTTLGPAVSTTTVPGATTTSTPGGSTTTVPGATTTTLPGTTTTIPTTTTTTGAATTTTTTTTSLPPGPSCCGEGSLDVFVHAKTSFNGWTNGGYWSWMHTNYESMIVWSPYWDSRLDDFGHVMEYESSYGIGVGSARASDHPDWILRDAGGNPAYIPFGCGQPGGCPRYAGDIGNQAFRDEWIATVQQRVNAGYTGVYLDDVNYEWRFGNASGGSITPIDPRTGQPLTNNMWRQYMTEFLEQVRAAFPGIEIWHNVIWYADSPDLSGALIDRQIRAADVVHLERSYNDPGLTAAGGRFGVHTFMDYVDRVHGEGRVVALIDEHATNESEQWYHLAGALLTNTGGDLVSTTDWSMIAPGQLFDGYLTDLGHALGPRAFVDGTIQREFTGGLVVLNEPRDATVTVGLGGQWRMPDGALVSQVTLGGGDAVVLTRP